jgi:hypothetical protein
MSIELSDRPEFFRRAQYHKTMQLPMNERERTDNDQARTTLTSAWSWSPLSANLGEGSASTLIAVECLPS